MPRNELLDKPRQQGKIGTTRLQVRTEISSIPGAELYISNCVALNTNSSAFLIRPREYPSCFALQSTEHVKNELGKKGR